MVESKYNYFIQEGDNVICLNGVSKNIFSISNSAFDFMKEILVNEELQAQEHDIVQELARMNFLVDTDKQETSLLLENKERDANSSLFHLVLNPTQDCIFRCWYCYETHLKSKMNEDTLNNLKKFVIKILEREDIDKFMLGWFGGEPLMYFDEIVYPLSLFTKQEAEKRGKSFFCNMTTNGFLLTKEVVEKCMLINLQMLQITLDGDEKRHNKTRNINGEPSFTKIVNNCVAYCSYSLDNKLMLRINYTDVIIRLKFAEILSIIPVEIRSQIEVQFKRIWQTYEKKTTKTPIGLLDNISDLEKEGFKQNQKMDFGFVEGCLCYADRNNYVNLNFDGRAYKCTAVNYNSNNALGYLNENGDIIWEDEVLRELSVKPYIENTKCMECNLLPICGGPCFQRKYQSIVNNVDFCVKDRVDTDMGDFIKKYYIYIEEKKAGLKLHVKKVKGSEIF